MTSVLACPKCPCKKFSVMAHVTEEWIVDAYGEFLRKGSDGEVTHRPAVGSSDYLFTCTECGATAVVVEGPPPEDCVDVTAGSDTKYAFDLLTARGHRQAAACLQNPGRVPLAEFRRALKGLEASCGVDRHPLFVFANYIDEHVVLGKDL